MWNPEKLPLVSPVALQKRLPFAISVEEISNFVGNFSLSLSAIPVSNRSKYLLHALIKELLILENIEAPESTFIIPEYIERVCANNTERCMIALDGLALPDKCRITDKNNVPLATIIQIHPVKSKVKGTITLDFGLSDKQILYLQPQSLIRIPTPEVQRLEIVIHLETGATVCEVDKKFEVEISSIGLIIDTRESDVLLKSDPAKAKQLAVEWLQSFDIPTSGI